MISDFRKEITPDTTLYAKWIEGVAVNFDVGTTGIGAVPTQMVSKNAKVTIPDSSNVPNKKMVLWYKESSFQTLFNFENETVSTSITLYAQLGDTNIRKIALTGYISPVEIWQII